VEAEFHKERSKRRIHEALERLSRNDCDNVKNVGY
jgi:hypothetical protein